MRDVGEGRAEGFLSDQFCVCVNLFAAPVGSSRLFAFLRDRRYRMLAWMYLVPLLAFWIGKGRFYYIAAAYPMLLAMGAVVGERWLAGHPDMGAALGRSCLLRRSGRCWAPTSCAVIGFRSRPAARFATSPSATTATCARRSAGTNSSSTVAGIRDSLPADEQQSLGITRRQLRRAGRHRDARPAYHLPPPISMTNSAWLRGYPTPPPTTLIVLGFSQKAADRVFTGCRLAGHNGNSEGIKNEESQDHPDIFVCGPPRKPWPVFWKDHQSFG